MFNSISSRFNSNNNHYFRNGILFSLTFLAVGTLATGLLAKYKIHPFTYFKSDIYKKMILIGSSATGVTGTISLTFLLNYLFKNKSDKDHSCPESKPKSSEQDSVQNAKATNKPASAVESYNPEQAKEEVCPEKESNKKPREREMHPNREIGEFGWEVSGFTNHWMAAEIEAEQNRAHEEALLQSMSTLDYIRHNRMETLLADKKLPAFLNKFYDTTEFPPRAENWLAQKSKWRDLIRFLEDAYRRFPDNPNLEITLILLQQKATFSTFVSQVVQNYMHGSQPNLFKKLMETKEGAKQFILVVNRLIEETEQGIASIDTHYSQEPLERSQAFRIANRARKFYVLIPYGNLSKIKIQNLIKLALLALDHDNQQYTINHKDECRYQPKFPLYEKARESFIELIAIQPTLPRPKIRYIVQSLFRQDHLSCLLAISQQSAQYESVMHFIMDYTKISSSDDSKDLRKKMEEKWQSLVTVLQTYTNFPNTVVTITFGYLDLPIENLMPKCQNPSLLHVKNGEDEDDDDEEILS